MLWQTHVVLLMRLPHLECQVSGPFEPSTRRHSRSELNRCAPPCHLDHFCLQHKKFLNTNNLDKVHDLRNIKVNCCSISKGVNTDRLTISSPAAVSSVFSRITPKTR